MGSRTPDVREHLLSQRIAMLELTQQVVPFVLQLPARHRNRARVRGTADLVSAELEATRHRLIEYDAEVLSNRAGLLSLTSESEQLRVMPVAARFAP